MRLVLLFLAIPLAVHSAPDPQYRQRLGNQGGRGGVRARGRGGGARGYGRRRPPPPVIEYDDGTNYEDSYESYNYSGENRIDLSFSVFFLKKGLTQLLTSSNEHLS